MHAANKLDVYGIAEVRKVDQVRLRDPGPWNASAEMQLVCKRFGPVTRGVSIKQSSFPPVSTLSPLSSIIRVR